MTFLHANEWQPDVSQPVGEGNLFVGETPVKRVDFGDDALFAGERFVRAGEAIDAEADGNVFPFRAALVKVAPQLAVHAEVEIFEHELRTLDQVAFEEAAR